MIKIAGFISDVHEEDNFLELALDFFSLKNISDVFCLGDICDGYGNIERTVSLMKEAGVISVKGNHDIWCINNEMRNLPNSTYSKDLSSQTRSYLKKLPKTLKVKSPSGEVILCHGILDNVMAQVTPYDSGYSLVYNIDLQFYLKSNYPKIMINGPFT